MAVGSCCESGISAIGPLPWGTHFCQFYKSREDLIETLVPYFVAGLKNNEACLWVTSEPLVARDAVGVMRKTLPDFDRYVESGQLEIVEFADWYLALGEVDADQVLAAWVERQQRALERGFSGLRLTGNTFWLEHSGWNDFMEYERKVNETFWKFRILALCTYSLDRCGAEEVLDVVRNHQFALTLRQGEWEVVENASLKIAKDELHRLNQELELRVSERTAELERLVRGREEYIATLAHELRNPLGAISNAVSVLEQADTGSNAHQRALEVAKRQIRQQTRMVDDLLDVSRLTHGSFALRRERVDLVGLCEQSMEDYRKVLENAGLHLLIEVPQTPVWVDVDPARLTQVLSNLLDNSAKFTPSGGSVALRIRHDTPNEQVEFSVSDTGAGIEPDLLCRLFAPFTQAAQSLDRAAGGLGLGLSLVKGIAELHGGEVWAESAGLGLGSTFYVRLPVAEEEGATEAPLTPEVAERRGPLRILVIEDLKDAAESVRDLLDLWGYAVEIAQSGPEGLRLAAQFRPDVILCDLGLPGMDGYQVAQRLREDATLRDSQLVAVSGYSGVQDLERVHLAGFDAHLAKPVDMDRLQNLLAARAAG